MNSSMLVPLISAIFFAASVSGNGELIILHHPKSLIFKGHDHVRENVLKELYSGALGLSTEQYSNWNGFFIENPFNLAEAVVTVAIDGVPDIGHSKGHHFSLRTNEEEFDLYTSLERRITEMYPEARNNLIRINLEDGLQELNKHEIFENVKNDKGDKPRLNQLKLAVEEDRSFLNDIALLNSIIEQIESENIPIDNTPDVFWFKIASMHPLRDLYGENSTQVKEAKQLLTDTILRLNTAFKKAYKGKVLVNVICSDAVHTRRTRNILQTPTPSNDVKIQNVAKDYNKDYPVIFNIILWFGVAMVFTLLAICIAIGDMDPGRDSIIYRMTSTRLKKD